MTGVPTCALTICSSPVQVTSKDGSPEASWIAIAAGQTHSAGIKSDGSLYTWGGCTSGELGNNNTTTRSAPIQVGTSSWTAAKAGVANTLAIRSDGALFAWGLNSNSQLGDGTTTNRSSPVQIGTSTWWTKLPTGINGDHSLAINNNNKLFAWGTNSVGQITLSNSSYSSPVQVGDSSWKAVAAGDDKIFAVTTNGILFAWAQTFPAASETVPLLLDHLQYK